LQNINGKSLPKWISISNDDKKDEDENYLFGQIQWDVNQTKNLDHDENFWVMATATFDNIIAYASILYVSFTFDPLTPL
jgi:hypothetical protein